MKITSQQRMIAALLAAAAIMFLYSTFLAPKPKPTPPPAPKPADTAATPAPAPAEKPASPPPGSPAPKLTGPRARVATPLYVADFQGGGIVGLAVRAYPMDDDQLIFSRLSEGGIPFAAPRVQAGPGAYWEVYPPTLSLKRGETGKIEWRLKEGERVLAVNEFTFNGNDYEIRGRVEAGGAGRPVTLTLGSFTRRDKDKRTDSEISYDALVGSDKIRDKVNGKTEVKPYHGDIPWAALRSQYFILAVLAPGGKGLVVERQDNVRIAAAYDITGGEYRLYVGPKSYERLKEYRVGLERTVDLGWSYISVIGVLILRLLNILTGITHNYGATILLFALIIKLVTYWPTQMQLVSSKKMQEIQPILKDLQKRYKDDPQRLNAETTAIYRKYKVNPVSGCLPMLLQIPIFMAMWSVLRNAIELKGAPFIGWITDLSHPDKVVDFGFTIPLVNISSLNILPIVMTLVSVIQSQTMNMGKGAVKTDQQKMMAFMPVIFGFLFYNVPSGLVLYWTAYQLLSIPQQVWVLRSSRSGEATS